MTAFCPSFSAVIPDILVMPVNEPPTARLNNITNEKYVTAPGYNTDGTNFFTSLTYNWF